MTEILHRSKDIKSLEIVDSELTSLAYKHIGKELYECTQLENDYSLQDSEAREDKQFSRLETLNLSGTILTKQDLTAIVKADRLISLKNLVLKHVNLSGCLGELLGPGFPSLTRIGLFCKQLTSDDIGSLAEALRRKRLPKLKHLDFSNKMHPFPTTEYDSGGGELEEMDFSYSTLSPDDIARIIKGAESLSRLIMLDLTHVHLCGSLGDVLTITNCQKSSSNHSELPTTSSIVTQFPSLKELILSRTGLNGDDLSAIATAITNGSLPRLSYLNLDENDFSGLESPVKYVIQACKDYYLSSSLKVSIELDSLSIGFQRKIRVKCKDSKVRLF